MPVLMQGDLCDVLWMVWSLLDIGPDWGRNANQRGGGPVKVLGERFSSSWGAFPLRLSRPRP